MKAIAVGAICIGILIAVIFVTTLREMSVSEASRFTWGSAHVLPKIMIPAGTVLPDGTVSSEAQASSGTVYGTFVVDGTLTVEGPLTVDGQVLVGDQMGCLLGATILRSRGNQNAEPPGKPVVIWKDTKVHGPLTIHGSLVVRRSLFFLGGISFGGTMGASCVKRLVFYPAGAYPIAQRIQFGCPAS